MCGIRSSWSDLSLRSTFSAPLSRIHSFLFLLLLLLVPTTCSLSIPKPSSSCCCRRTTSLWSQLDLIAGGACSTASLFLLVDNFMVLCVFGVVLNFGTWDLVMLLWKESVCVRCWKLRSDVVLGAKRIVAGELQAWNGLGI